MRKCIFAAGITGLLMGSAGVAVGQQAPAEPTPYVVGNPLGLPITPGVEDPTAFNAISSNVKVFGAIYSTESCTYDAERDLIVAPARGVGQAFRANDAFVALINHDGSVNTARWIGVQNPGAQRDNLTPPQSIWPPCVRATPWTPNAASTTPSPERHRRRRPRTRPPAISTICYSSCNKCSVSAWFRAGRGR